MSLFFNVNCSEDGLSENSQNLLAQWDNDCRAIKLSSPMIVVSVCVVNEHNQVLLGKLAEEDSWTVPMAWMRSDDRSLSTCGQRAVYSETGLVVEKLKNFILFDSGFVQMLLQENRLVREHIMVFQYTTKTIQGQIEQGLLNDRDLLHSYQQYACWQWFDAHDLPENIDGIGFSKKEILEVLENQE